MRNLIDTTMFVLALGIATVQSTFLATPQDAETVTVQGAVTNPETGEPVPDATVNFAIGNPGSRPVQTTISASDGKFTVKNLKPGQYRVTVTRNGFTTPQGFNQSSTGDIPSVGRVFTIAAGNPAGTFIQLLLIRTATISGRVFDERGEPRSAVTVVLLEKGYDSISRATFTQATSSMSRAVTDDRGQYELSRIRPGNYYVRADGGTPTFPATFFPSATAADQAAPVTVSSGSGVGGIDIKASPRETFSIHLKIAGSDLPIEYFSMRERSGLPFMAVSKELGGGVFVLSKVPMGEYDLDIVLFQAQPARLDNHRVHVAVVDKDVDLGTVLVDSQVPVTGRITVPIGATMPRAITLYPIDNGIGVPVSTAVKPEDGAFEFEKVSRGQYRLQANAESPLYIRSVRYGAREVLGTGLVIDGPPPGPIEVTLDHSPSKVEGVVRNARNEPVAFCRVALIPDANHRGNPDLYATAVTDENGRFSIAKVTPGNYRALAWDYAPQNAYKNAEFLAPFLNRAIPVDAMSGLTNVIELRAVD